MSCSSSSRTRKPPDAWDSPVTERGDTSRVPNFTACSIAAGRALPRTHRAEAEIVLDPRRAAGLAPDRHILDDDHAQPLRGPVDGGRQPRRAGAHHEQVAASSSERHHRSIPSAVARSRVVGAVSTRCSPVTTTVPVSGSGRRRRQLRPRRRVRPQDGAVGELVAPGELLQPVEVAVVVAGEQRPPSPRLGSATVAGRRTRRAGRG